MGRPTRPLADIAPAAADPARARTHQPAAAAARVRHWPRATLCVRAKWPRAGRRLTEANSSARERPEAAQFCASMASAHLNAARLARAAARLKLNFLLRGAQPLPLIRRRRRRRPGLGSGARLPGAYVASRGNHRAAATVRAVTPAARKKARPPAREPARKQRQTTREPPASSEQRGLLAGASMNARRAGGVLATRDARDESSISADCNHLAERKPPAARWPSRPTAREPLCGPRSAPIIAGIRPSERG